jgi:hypothetical protein
VLRVPHRLGVGLTLFISGGNPHLTSRYCGVVLGPTTISKKNIENVAMASTLKKTAIKRFFQALYFFLSSVENGSTFVNDDTKFIDGGTLPNYTMNYMLTFHSINTGSSDMSVNNFNACHSSIHSAS